MRLPISAALLAWSICGFAQAPMPPANVSVEGGVALPPPDPNGLRHGDTYVVRGSGFGQKSGLHVYDDCTSSTRPWDRMRPSSAASQYNLQCRPVGFRSVPGPHPNSTGYLAGTFQGTGADSGQSVDIQERFSGGGYVIFSAYRRFDPLWDFGGQDNNKIFGLSNGPDMYAPPYVYVQYESNGFPNGTVLPYINVYDPQGGYMSPTGPLWSQRREIANLTRSWIRHEFVVKLGSNGRLTLTSDGTRVVDISASIGGSSGIAGIGGYSGQRSSNNYSYFTDVYFDAGPNPGRIYLCSGSVCELQPYTAWSDSQITIRIAKGRLPSGTATVRFVSELTGDRDLGTVSLR
jgi:hypothetical protein